MTTHVLKCWPLYFHSIYNGDKTFEVRKNDRDFKKGDRLILREYDPETNGHTGRELVLRVTYIMQIPAAFIGEKTTGPMRKILVFDDCDWVIMGIEKEGK